MLEQLFGSKTRLKLLRTFLREPDTAFFVRELARAIDMQINAVRRELKLLLDIGLVEEIEYAPEDSDTSGASLRKYYRLNTSSIIYDELHALLLKDQVVGEEKFIEDLKGKAGDIRLLVLSGQFTHDLRAGTDLLLVGTIRLRALDKLVARYEKEFGFSIRYTVMTEREFIERRYVMDKFIFSLFEAKHIKAVDLLM